MPSPIQPKSRAARLSLIHVPEPQAAESFADAVRQGLASNPKTLPCRYFYDAIGSLLFEKICELPEYYLTRIEDALLARHSDAMLSGWDDAPVLIELGSGSSTKTRRLIGSALDTYGSLRYMPIDVSATILEESARRLVDEFPMLRVSAVAGSYQSALTQLSERIHRPKLLVFLGSSLGNYTEDEAVRLLRHIASTMGRQDRLLLGTDLVKDRSTLEAAYDDAAGVTAAFNRNLLVRINRELGADFEIDAFAHQARYRDDLDRVEMHLASIGPQRVTIPGAGISIRFDDGETIHTENSHKYTTSRLKDLADRSGLVEEAAWTDPLNSFRVQRWRLRG